MTVEKGRRKLKIDVSELIFAMENASWENRYYLDLETGETILVTSETWSELEAIYEEIPGETEDEDDLDLESAINQLQIPDWQKQVLLEANTVEKGLDDRFIEIPRAESDEAFDDMAEFIETVADQNLQRRLSQALARNHPFRRFKDILADNPVEREQWFKFKEERQKERIREWLEDQEVEPVF